LNLAFFFAKKYFRSKKKKNFIHFISRVSMIGVAVGTMALIVVLSVFNGLEGFLLDLYRGFDPDLKIVPVEGKTFEPSDSLMFELRNMDGVLALSEVVEENVLVEYRKTRLVIRVKGIEPAFLDGSPLAENVVQGKAKLIADDGKPLAIVGRGVQYFLSLSMDDPFNPIQLFFPKNLRPGILSPGDAYTQLALFPAGVFAIEKEFDDNFIILPLSQAARLTNYGNRRTSLEIRLKNPDEYGKWQSQINSLLGPNLKVLNSKEQHDGLLKALKLEKLFVFFTFSFILLLASFNIFFSLSLLAIEKKKDIAMLFAMGANTSLVRKIFLYEGALIALSGAFIGLILGVLITLIQQEFGLVRMGAEASIIDAYPVKLRLSDLLYVTASIIAITLLISFRPAYLATKVDTGREL